MNNFWLAFFLAAGMTFWSIITYIVVYFLVGLLGVVLAIIIIFGMFLLVLWLLAHLIMERPIPTEP